MRLLKIGEDDFETLEQDQLGVQGMMASRYLATFETEITAWQKSLSMVSDVVGQLTEIQRNWSYLEPLFIGSDEVRKELPAVATRFEAIDKDVKEILRSADATKNVRDACNKVGAAAGSKRGESCGSGVLAPFLVLQFVFSFMSLPFVCPAVPSAALVCVREVRAHASIPLPLCLNLYV